MRDYILECDAATGATYVAGKDGRLYPEARVVASAPGDAAARGELIALAEALGRPRELVAILGDALAALRKAATPAAEVHAMAVDLARRVAGDPQTASGAEKAWMTVLGLDATDGEAYAALATSVATPTARRAPRARPGRRSRRGAWRGCAASSTGSMRSTTRAVIAGRAR